MAKIKMYKKNPCPFCDRAMNFFNDKKLQVEVIDLTGKPEEIDRIKNETGWRTVPIILINDQLIGGYNDLKALDESGELDQLLKN
jgi:glutaredoxin 3